MTGLLLLLVPSRQMLVREGVAGLIGVQPDMTLVGEACNGREAIQQFRTYHPDIYADGPANAGDERPRCAHCYSK